MAQLASGARATSRHLTGEPDSHLPNHHAFFALATTTTCPGCGPFEATCCLLALKDCQAGCQGGQERKKTGRSDANDETPRWNLQELCGGHEHRSTKSDLPLQFGGAPLVLTRGFTLLLRLGAGACQLATTSWTRLGEPGAPTPPRRKLAFRKPWNKVCCA